jgi:hypothetical protein
MEQISLLILPKFENWGKLPPLLLRFHGYWKRRMSAKPNSHHRRKFRVSGLLCYREMEEVDVWPRLTSIFDG